MTDTEQSMKEALDGKFFSFAHDSFSGLKISERAVPKDYSPTYNRVDPFEASGQRGGKARQKICQDRRAVFWTPAKIEHLKQLRAKNHGARIMGRMLGTSRTEVGIQLNKMGILSTIGQPYNSRPHN